MSETSVPQSMPEVNPPTAGSSGYTASTEVGSSFDERISWIAEEDDAINAVILLLRAQRKAHNIGLACFRLEQGLRPISTETAKQDYVQLVMDYRQALAEMSAARYALVLVLGW